MYGVGGVRPQLDGPAVRARPAAPGEPVAGSRSSSVNGVVDLQRADRAAASGSRTRSPRPAPSRSAARARLGEDPRPPRAQLERAVVERAARARREIRVLPGAERTRRRRRCWRRGSSRPLSPLVAERVGDRHVERKRPARSCGCSLIAHRSRGRPRARASRQLRHRSSPWIALCVLGLGQRELVLGRRRTRSARRPAGSATGSAARRGRRRRSPSRGYGSSTGRPPIEYSRMPPPTSTIVARWSP